MLNSLGWSDNVASLCKTAKQIGQFEDEFEEKQYLIGL